MAESLKDLAMRLKQNKASQNTPQKISQDEIKETPKETEGLDEKASEEAKPEKKKEVKEETQTPENKTEDPKQKELSKEDQVAMEIEMLQNDGRFRVELLHQLIEINKALRVVAGVLVELTQDGTEKSK